MAVKIIVRGDDKAARPIRTTCRECKTVFEFLKTDARYVNDQRDGDFYHISCPVCGHGVNRAVNL